MRAFEKNVVMNINHIAVISKQNNGLLKFTKREITNNYIDIIDRLKEMEQNSNRTILDMQQCFVKVFAKKDYFDMCWPHSYSSSYISGIGYPKYLTYDEYESMLKKELDTLKGSELQNNELENKIQKYKQELKYDFLNRCIKYIHGYNFKLEKSKIINESEIIMSSSERIGFTNYTYNVNEDVVISINTNFGYGYSSYFLLSMKYKGIEILPYSAMIHYYHANIIELKRYTRQYDLVRDSWNVAFDFVVESVNLATTNPDVFIKKFIINEVNEMVLGLKNIACHPNTEIKRFLDNSNKSLINGMSYSVRNISWNEKIDYKVYWNEMDIAFKAEKITGALMFLEQLSELVEIFPAIQTSIDEIKSLNINLAPEIERTIADIAAKINKDCLKSEKLEESIENLKKQIIPHEENIKKIQASCSNDSEKVQIKEKYRSDEKNAEYARLCSELDKLQRENSELKGHVQKRRNFIEQLKECQNRIQTYIIAA